MRPGRPGHASGFSAFGPTSSGSRSGGLALRRAGAPAGWRSGGLALRRAGAPAGSRSGGFALRRVRAPAGSRPGGFAPRSARAPAVSRSGGPRSGRAMLRTDRSSPGSAAPCRIYPPRPPDGARPVRELLIVAPGQRDGYPEHASVAGTEVPAEKYPGKLFAVDNTPTAKGTRSRITALTRLSVPRRPDFGTVDIGPLIHRAIREPIRRAGLPGRIEGARSGWPSSHGAGSAPASATGGQRVATWRADGAAEARTG